MDDSSKAPTGSSIAGRCLKPTPRQCNDKPLPHTALDISTALDRGFPCVLGATWGRTLVRTRSRAHPQRSYLAPCARDPLSVPEVRALAKHKALHVERPPPPPPPKPSRCRAHLLASPLSFDRRRERTTAASSTPTPAALATPERRLL